MKYPPAIQNLINLFTTLPSVGPKTAERYVFYLLKENPDYMQRLAQAIAELKEKTTICNSCQAVAESDPCHICLDKTRENSSICVVATTREMLNIETTNEFKGQYHVLNGLIDMIKGLKPEQLNIKQLENKVKQGKIKEIILALSPNMEGETTALYLNKSLNKYKIKITRIAKGLPSGAEIEYADELTLGNALKYRTKL
ncbi:recombination protein RecR [Candidatus Parcubacteria bacterium]|nr:recombination protein RecR [Candidatus Parcubacteria bacterium]